MKSSAKPCSVKRKKTFASALNPTKYLGLTRWVSSDRCFSAQDWLDCKHSSIEPFWLYSKEVAADKTYCAICENNFIFKFLFISSRPVLSHRALVVLCGHTSQLDRQTRLMFCQPWPAFFLSRWDISVICPAIVLKLAVTVFCDRKNRPRPQHPPLPLIHKFRHWGVVQDATSVHRTNEWAISVFIRL